MTGTRITARPERLEGVAQIGGPDEVHSDNQARGFIHEQLVRAVDGRTVCIVVPGRIRRRRLSLLLAAVTAPFVGNPWQSVGNQQAPLAH